MRKYIFPAVMAVSILLLVTLEALRKLPDTFVMVGWLLVVLIVAGDWLRTYAPQKHL